MAQRFVEIALGKLICDVQFRRAFQVNPDRASQAYGLVLTPIELDALSHLRWPGICAVALQLDPRIRLATAPSLDALSKW
jgi:hypothetical protein